MNHKHRGPLLVLRNTLFVAVIVAAAFWLPTSCYDDSTDQRAATPVVVQPVVQPTVWYRPWSWGSSPVVVHHETVVHHVVAPSPPSTVVVHAPAPAVRAMPPAVTVKAPPPAFKAVPTTVRVSPIRTPTSSARPMSVHAFSGGHH